MCQKVKCKCRVSKVKCVRNKLLFSNMKHIIIFLYWQVLTLRFVDSCSLCHSLCQWSFLRTCWKKDSKPVTLPCWVWVTSSFQVSSLLCCCASMWGNARLFIFLPLLSEVISVFSIFSDLEKKVKKIKVLTCSSLFTAWRKTAGHISTPVFWLTSLDWDLPSSLCTPSNMHRWGCWSVQTSAPMLGWNCTKTFFLSANNQQNKSINLEPTCTTFNYH